MDTSSDTGRARPIAPLRQGGAWQSSVNAGGWNDRLLRLLAPPSLRSLPAIWRYALAGGLVALATATRWALIPFLGTIVPYNVWIVAAAVATALLGIGPGLLFVLAGIIAVEVFVLGSLPTLFTTATLARMGFTAAAGVIISVLQHGIRVAATKAQDSAARLASFAAATFEGIVESEGGRILDCNEQLAEMLRRPVSELRGMMIADLVVPEDRGRVLANIDSNRESMIEHGMVRGDGTRIVVEAHGRPVASGSTRRHTALRDITERKQAEEALRESEASYRSLFENLLDGFAYCKVLYDERGRPADFLCLEVNESFARLTGLTDVVGKRVSEIIPGIRETEPDLFERCGRVAVTANPDRFEIYFKPLAIWLAISVYSPHQDHFVAVFDNISQRKNAEAERERLVEALKETDRRKTEFLAMLSHELRNPLAPIRNAVSLLRLIGPTEPRLERARDLIDRQVTHLVRLVDDLLDVSRLTRGTIPLRKERVNLSTVVQRAVEISRPLITGKRLALTVSCAPEAITVEADPARLVQVISNLLNNAAKFTDPGGTITLTTEPRDTDALIHVRDTGRGIDPGLLPHIFDMFVQGEMSLDRAESGLGIGLALARHLVEQHGGSIEARSAGCGRGSEFLVTLPTVGSLSAVLADTVETGSARPDRPLRILVVEDNLDVAESFMMLLEVHGHEIRAAQTGHAALQLAEAFVADVAFIDIGLPDLDGYEVARQLRALPRFQGTVLVALSGYGADQDKRRAQAAGFDHHLTKPVDPSTIYRLLVDISRFGEPPVAVH